MILSLIAAVADNGVIGRNNKLPWYLPGDLKYFRRMTMGKPVIMGRATWESMRRPLPGRSNIVISRQEGYQADGARVVKDLDAALEIAESVGLIEGLEEIFVIGGAEIYRLALAQADRLYITEVHAEVEGDVRFPEWDRESWAEIHREPHPATGTANLAYSFVVYERS